jgi:hypothetical protein
MMKLTGAQVVWESLVREGVETIFGITGGAVIHLAMPAPPGRSVSALPPLALGQPTWLPDWQRPTWTRRR